MSFKLNKNKFKKNENDIEILIFCAKRQSKSGKIVTDIWWKYRQSQRVALKIKKVHLLIFLN